MVDMVEFYGLWMFMVDITNYRVNGGFVVVYKPTFTSLVGPILNLPCLGLS